MGEAPPPPPAPSSSVQAQLMERKSQEFKISSLVLRACTMALLFVALMLMVTDKQTQSIPLKLPGMGTTIFLKRTATFSEIKGVQFYVGAIAVVLIYLFFQMVVSFFAILTSGSIVGSVNRAWITFIMDQLIAYLLVSAATAVAEIGYIAKQGEKRVGWNQVCSDFKHFCTIYGFSLVNAFLAAATFLPVVAISAFHLFRMYGMATATKH